MPISAVIGRADIIDGAVPGTLGGTYGGNPVCCAAALAALDRMEALDLCARAVHIGARLTEHFRALARRHDWIVDVRGLGAMVGFEICEGADPTRPAAAETRRILDACVQRGLLVLSAGVRGNVIRALPPLVITDPELERALQILGQAVEEVLP